MNPIDDDTAAGPEPIRTPSASHTALAAVALSCVVGCAGGGSGSDAPSAPAQAPAATAPELVRPADYQLVWSDEFDTPGLPDPAKWMYDTGMNRQGWHNRELQYYSGPRAENAVQRDGKLIITARKESMSSAPDWGGQRYTSTRLNSAGRTGWTYGFFEIRAKLPCGKGTWPAIWMLGSSGPWPAAGELDIMEQTGKDPTRVFSTTHTTAGSGGKGVGAGTQVNDACTAFHTYQMHWTAQQASFGIDGKTHFTYRNAGTGKDQWPFDAPQFLILNIAIGGDLGGEVDDSIFPVQMEVEFVRVYQKAR